MEKSRKSSVTQMGEGNLMNKKVLVLTLAVFFVMLFSGVAMAFPNMSSDGVTCTPCHTDGRTGDAPAEEPAAAEPAAPATAAKSSNGINQTVKFAYGDKTVELEAVNKSGHLNVKAADFNSLLGTNVSGDLVPVRSKAADLGFKVHFENGTVYLSGAAPAAASPAPAPAPAPAATGMSALETVSAISAEWLQAGHANTGDPLAYAGIRGSCGQCHSGNSLERWGTDNPYSAEGIERVDGNFVVTAHEGDLPSPIGCATCHASKGGEILESGIMPAEFNPFGEEEWNVGNSNALCFSCHNARRDVDELYEVYTEGSEENETEYPHHGWSSLATGQGGIEYPGISYPQSGTHNSLGCVGCHMGTEDGYVSHTFEPDVATCQSCHTTATDFEIGTLKAELEEKLATLEELVLANIPGAVGIGASHGSTPAFDANGDAVWNADIPAEALIGAYNWAIISQELEHGASGAHNPKYAKALLDESIKKLEALE